MPKIVLYRRRELSSSGPQVPSLASVIISVDQRRQSHSEMLNFLKKGISSVVGNEESKYRSFGLLVSNTEFYLKFVPEFSPPPIWNYRQEETKLMRIKSNQISK